MNTIENRKIWKNRINDQSKSGITIVKYCQDNDLDPHQFHYYKRQFKHGLGKKKDKEVSSFVEVIQPEVIVDDRISMKLNDIDVTMNQLNLIKFLQTVKGLD